MTNDQLKHLETKLWDSANALRAYGGLKAADYAVPVLGLIFLKFADNKYSQHPWGFNDYLDKQLSNAPLFLTIEDKYVMLTEDVKFYTVDKRKFYTTRHFITTPLWWLNS